MRRCEGVDDVEAAEAVRNVSGMGGSGRAPEPLREDICCSFRVSAVTAGSEKLGRQAEGHETPIARPRDGDDDASILRLTS